MFLDRSHNNPGPRTALVVLGMHRSGTSALTRVLNLLGAALPRNLMPAGPGNELGHWEPIRVAALHDEMLASLDSTWSALTTLDEAWFETSEAACYVERIKELIGSEYGDAPLFVVKDPRLCLFFRLWSRAFADLNIACKPILAIRNPLEVAESLCVRERRNRAGDAWSIDRAGLLALRYNLAAERWTRHRPRVFCLYDDLLRNWRNAARRMSEELGQEWPNWSLETEMAVDAFLRLSQRHHKAGEYAPTEAGIWADTINPVFLALRDACAGAPVDSDALDRIAAAYDSGYRMFLRSMDAWESDLLHRISILQTEKDHAKRQVALLTESTSWKLTAPLRRIAQELRALRRGFGVNVGEGAGAGAFATLQIEPAE